VVCVTIHASRVYPTSDAVNALKARAAPRPGHASSLAQFHPLSGFPRVSGRNSAAPVAAHGQQSMPVIGVLGSASAIAYSERLMLIRQALVRQALAEAGFIEGHTVAMEYRWAAGQLDRLPALTVDLVGRKVNVIIATDGVQASRGHALKLYENLLEIVTTNHQRNRAKSVLARQA